MKIRKGFVSNSSSSSFIINMRGIDQEIVRKVCHFNHLVYAKITPDGFYSGQGLPFDKQYKFKDPFIQNLTDDEFNYANSLDYDEGWKFESHVKDPNIIFAETAMDNGLLRGWCDLLGVDLDQVLYWEDQHELILEPSLVNPFMSLIELNELLDSARFLKCNIGFYLDLRENKFYEEPKLLNHFSEAKKVSHIFSIFNEFEYEKYEQWNIHQHPENPKVFICWTHTGNPFPFIEWCCHIGIKKREICFYKYYEDEPSAIELAKIDELKFERMY